MGRYQLTCTDCGATYSGFSSDLHICDPCLMRLEPSEIIQRTKDARAAKKREEAASRATDEAIASAVCKDLTPSPLTQGYYALEYNGKRYRFAVEKRKLTSHFAPGASLLYIQIEAGRRYQMFAIINGEQLHPFTRFLEDSEMVAAARVLLTDPYGAGLLYAKQTGNCFVCGRELTDEESVKRGYGPVCKQYVEALLGNALKVN